MHVNYFERSYTLATLFDKAKFYGYDGVELRGSAEGLTTPKYIAQVKKEITRTGLAVTVQPQQPLRRRARRRGREVLGPAAPGQRHRREVVQHHGGIAGRGGRSLHGV
jgi:sugar phosphate isomerase/epimerase